MNEMRNYVGKTINEINLIRNEFFSRIPPKNFKRWERN